VTGAEMKLLDRVLFVAYVKSYLIVLTSLLSLYIIVDLFTNLDDFTARGTGVAQAARHIAEYYSYRVSQIFDRLCEAIVLLAAMFTVSWMQRNNELLPYLSAGVPTRRVIRPVLAGSLALMTLGVLNQELVIPRIADALMRGRDDRTGDKDLEVQGGYDSNGIHVEGYVATRKTKTVRFFYVTVPETLASGLVHISAAEAQYIPPGEGRYSGGWLLTGATPLELDNWTKTDVLEMIDPGRYFLHTTELTFESVTRQSRWYQFASTNRLRELLRTTDSPRLAPMAVMFHMRLTRPLLGVLLVFLGLSMILRDQNRHVFINAGLCLVMCGMFFAAVFGCKYLGENDYVSPALAAWLPVLVFGPFAFALFDAIHT
jgi:lipopolysaccharide export system permease protein